MLYQELGRLEDAEAMMLAALEMTLATKSEDHSDVLGARTNLGGLYLSLGRFAEAAAQTEISRPRMLRVLGPDHQWTSNATYILANSYTRLGRDEEALPLHRDFLAAQLRALERAGDAAPAGELARMAWWLLSYEVEDARDPERALPFARAACEAAVARGDRAHFEYLDLLAQAQFATGDIEAAVASEERALELMPQGAEGWLREEFEQRLADYREALGE
jgi:tetratricopeptide (TPR) repeat protein